MTLPTKHYDPRFAHFTDAMDVDLLRQANAVGWRAREAGDEPYGCLLADRAGRVVATGECNVRRLNDPTKHGEMMMIEAALAAVGPEGLAECSAYVSGGPCCMCAGAIYWAGIGRLVYATDIGAADNRPVTETGAKPTLRVGFLDVFGAGSRRMVIDGPYPELRDEILKRFEGFTFK